MRVFYTFSPKLNKLQIDEFLQKWYPVHAFMAEYNVIMGIGSEMNLHSSVFALSKFIPTATAEIEFVNHLPKIVQ